jgi:hypothetical protein
MKKSILIIILIFSMALYSYASSGGVKQQQGTGIGTVVGAGIVKYTSSLSQSASG